jgi:hypothetical protein
MPDSPVWLPLLERALAEADAGALVAIPKADLHCHGLLSVPLGTYERVRGRSLPPPPRVFGDFERFGAYIIEHLLPALTDGAAVRALVRAAFERLVADGVVYAEMSFDLLLPQAVEALGLTAVHHGVRAAEDPETAAWLAERGVVLHVCPTSNYSLGVCASLESHPARALFEQGVALTVNTDDFTLFGAGACDELLNLARMGFSTGEIARVIENGLAQEGR